MYGDDVVRLSVVGVGRRLMIGVGRRLLAEMGGVGVEGKQQHLGMSFFYENNTNDVEFSSSMSPFFSTQNCRQTIKVERDWDSFLSAWKLLEDSPTWISYMENYKQLQLFLRKYPRVLSYVDDNWLNNHKEKFVSAWCDQSLNFGNRDVIPLDSVDIFWRTLDVSWSTPLEHEDIQCDDELHISRKHSKAVKRPEEEFCLQDVRGDGNCGFRSVAVALGLSEDQWPRIRSDLVRELEDNHQKYKYIFGTTGYKKIYNTVRFAGKWMEMPNTGLIIASAYNRVVITLANGGNVGGCTTTFPLWSSPPQSDALRRCIAMCIWETLIKRHCVMVALYR
ncbi:hypothetical protein Tco_1059837 [Tanacetum coccineum]